MPGSTSTLTEFAEHEFPATDENIKMVMNDANRLAKIGSAGSKLVLLKMIIIDVGFRDDEDVTE